MSCLNWRIALSEAALSRGYLFLRGISEPNTAPYADYSGKFSQSDGGAILHGFKNINLTWAELQSQKAWFLKNYVDNALAGTGLLYLTISKNNADGIGRHFVDVRGIPHPVQAEEGGVIVGSDGRVYYQNFRIFVNNLVIINDPALF